MTCVLQDRMGQRIASHRAAVAIVGTPGIKMVDKQLFSKSLVSPARIRLIPVDVEHPEEVGGGGTDAAG